MRKFSLATALALAMTVGMQSDVFARHRHASSAPVAAPAAKSAAAGDSSTVASAFTIDLATIAALQAEFAADTPAMQRQLIADTRASIAAELAAINPGAKSNLINRLAKLFTQLIFGTSRGHHVRHSHRHP